MKSSQCGAPIRQALQCCAIAFLLSPTQEAIRQETRTRQAGFRSSKAEQVWWLTQDDANTGSEEERYEASESPSSQHHQPWFKHKKVILQMLFFTTKTFSVEIRTYLLCKWYQLGSCCCWAKHSPHLPLGGEFGWSRWCWWGVWGEGI